MLLVIALRLSSGKVKAKHHHKRNINQTHNIKVYVGPVVDLVMVPRMIVSHEVDFAQHGPPHATNAMLKGITTKAVVVVVHVVIGVTGTLQVDFANSNKIIQGSDKRLIKLKMNCSLALTSWQSSLR